MLDTVAENASISGEGSSDYPQSFRWLHRTWWVQSSVKRAPATVKGYKMTEKNVKQWLANRKSGIKINPETAEIDWFHDLAGFWLDAMVNEGAPVQNCYVYPPANCDLCERALAQEEYFVDGHVKALAACGFMCADCFGEYGAGLGLGVGQLYRRERDGRWLLVPGEEYDGERDRGRGKHIIHMPAYAYVRSCRGLHQSMSRCHRTRSLCRRAGSRGRRQ
jgi:hypothetical protein